MVAPTFRRFLPWETECIIFGIREVPGSTSTTDQFTTLELVLVSLCDFLSLVDIPLVVSSNDSKLLTYYRPAQSSSFSLGTMSIWKNASKRSKIRNRLTTWPMLMTFSHFSTERILAWRNRSISTTWRIFTPRLVRPSLITLWWMTTRDPPPDTSQGSPVFRCWKKRTFHGWLRLV